MKILAENKKALFNYEILETLEAGVELFGFEAKAIQNCRINLSGAFATVKNRQLWLTNADIPPYQPANTPKDYDSKRARRLLLHRSEISSLLGKLKTKGLTIIPISVYNKAGLIKIRLGLARSKKKFDKREEIKKRDIEREIGRTLKR